MKKWVIDSVEKLPVPVRGSDEVGVIILRVAGHFVTYPVWY